MAAIKGGCSAPHRRADSRRARECRPRQKPVQPGFHRRQRLLQRLVDRAANAIACPQFSSPLLDGRSGTGAQFSNANFWDFGDDISRFVAKNEGRLTAGDVVCRVSSVKPTSAAWLRSLAIGNLFRLRRPTPRDREPRGFIDRSQPCARQRVQRPIVRFELRF